ncbi:MAG: hypothetical protein QOJ11_3840 [Frankiales bacterium]|jgi:hypothetical protein|nr:hypothetical protein [Frankiales bacterium]
MTGHGWAPVLVPLAEWLSPLQERADPGLAEWLELRDARLTDARSLLCGAEALITGTVGRHRPAASGPAAAVELDLVAERLTTLGRQGNDYPGAEDDPTLLRRAAVLCAGGQWTRLAALLPTLRLRISAVTEAIAGNAVQLRRLDRATAPPLALAPSPEVAAFAREETAVADELRRRTAKAGADSAYAAADGAFLPSLSDFLQ